MNLKTCKIIFLTVNIKRRIFDCKNIAYQAKESASFLSTVMESRRK